MALSGMVLKGPNINTKHQPPTLRNSFFFQMVDNAQTIQNLFENAQGEDQNRYSFHPHISFTPTKCSSIRKSTE